MVGVTMVGVAMVGVAMVGVAMVRVAMGFCLMATRTAKASPHSRRC